MPQPRPTETAMSAAFKAANTKTPREQLRALATKALKKYPKDREAAARKMLIDAEDAGLLLTLFEPWHRVATMDYLAGAAKALGDGFGDGQARLAEKARSEMPSPQLNRRSIDAAASVRNSEALNLLVSYRKVDGKPLSEITGGRCRTWARETKFDGRFIELVSAGVPDNSTVGQHLTPEEVARLYFQAKAETSNV